MTSISFRSYWKNISPIYFLACASLLVLSTSRLAYALITAAALIWVYSLTSLALSSSGKFLPKTGRPILYAFIASFIASIYLFLLWLIFPLCALETFFIITLTPVLYISKDFNTLSVKKAPVQAVLDSLYESFTIGILILIFALIREPLGFMSLSLPGIRGITLLFSAGVNDFFPIHIFASTGGALLLLGYFLGFYGYFSKKAKQKEEK